MAEIQITKQNFDQEVLQSDQPVLLDFWASWCGPCRMLAPELSALAKEKEGSLKIGKINVDEEMELANQFRVSSIPLLVLVRNDKIVRQEVGYRPKAAIESMLK